MENKMYDILKDHIDNKFDLVLGELKSQKTENADLKKELELYKKEQEEKNKKYDKKLLYLFVALTLIINKVEIPKSLLGVFLDASNLR